MTDGRSTEPLLSLAELGPAPVAKQTPEPEFPVAKVLIDSSLPHLDRLFDYAVPFELAAQAQPGVRVRVRFAGRDVAGFLVARSERSESGRRLNSLSRVVGELPVLTPEIFELAEQVAARYAGSVSDVLRVAIPPRVAKVEKEFSGVKGPVASPGQSSPLPPFQAFAGYPRATAFLERLSAGLSPRAAMLSIRGYGPQAWHRQLAEAIGVCWFGGRGAVAVVPDQRELDTLCVSVAELLGEESFVRLTAEDGPTARYRAFLRLLTGDRRIALGTRSAAFAPVREPGLLCCWDDGDDVLIERRAPYQHAREVLLLRAQLQGSGVLLGGYSRSSEVARLVKRDWLQPIDPDRAALRQLTPRVVSTADSVERERDPLAAAARLPHRAWLTAQQGLRTGPVLVQVARAGYVPALFCDRCREPARCRHCSGPLGQNAFGERPSCRWCATPEPVFCCAHCGSPRLRRGAAGAERTAEELGRAFPRVTVVSSSRDQVKATIPDRPALVVATVGAEPVAEYGYTAALLLDGDRLLSRENLRAEEEAMRRWLSAAVLVRPHQDGGQVVCVASDTAVAAALVRWDPAGFAEREFEQRIALGLPPAVRVLSVTGPLASVRGFVDRLALAEPVRSVGPAPLDCQRGEYRSLVFIPYQQAAEVTARARAVKAASSAGRAGESVQVRCDGVDLL